MRYPDDNRGLNKVPWPKTRKQRLTHLKGTEACDDRFSSAVLEDFYNVSATSASPPASTDSRV